MKKWILIGVSVFAIVGLSVGGALFVTGAFSDAPVTAENADAQAAKPERKELFYYNIQPEFVVNFRRNERPRVLMAEISVSTHEEKAIEVLDTHTPEMRNNLLMLLSEQDGSTLSTAEGKNELRTSVKTALNKVIAKHSEPHEIEDAFFIRFVLQ